MFSKLWKRRGVDAMQRTMISMCSDYDVHFTQTSRGGHRSAYKLVINGLCAFLCAIHSVNTTHSAEKSSLYLFYNYCKEKKIALYTIFMTVLHTIQERKLISLLMRARSFAVMWLPQQPSVAWWTSRPSAWSTPALIPGGSCGEIQFCTPPVSPNYCSPRSHEQQEGKNQLPWQLPSDLAA